MGFGPMPSTEEYPNWGCTRYGEEACKQSKSAPPAQDNTQTEAPATEAAAPAAAFIAGALPSAAATPLANLSMAFVAGALTMMAAVGLVVAVRRRQEAETEHALIQESDTEEPVE